MVSSERSIGSIGKSPWSHVSIKMAGNGEGRTNVWLDEEGELFEYSAQSPAPSKDFNQVVVSPTQVILRWWKISHRSSDAQRLNPGEIKISHEEFLEDDEAQSRMTRAFGENMTEYITNLCRGKLDYMERLPDKALLQILLRVDLQDIGRMSQLNKHFSRLCNEDQLWREKFAEASLITDELTNLAKQKGWKPLYFSDKLRIQLQLSRKRKMIEVKPASAPISRPRRSARNKQ